MPRGTKTMAATGKGGRAHGLEEKACTCKAPGWGAGAEQRWAGARPGHPSCRALDREEDEVGPDRSTQREQGAAQACGHTAEVRVHVEIEQADEQQEGRLLTLNSFGVILNISSIPFHPSSLAAEPTRVLHEGLRSRPAGPGSARDSQNAGSGHDSQSRKAPGAPASHGVPGADAAH